MSSPHSWMRKSEVPSPVIASNHQSGLGIIPHGLAESAHIIHHRGGGFRGLDEHGAERPVGCGFCFIASMFTGCP